MVISNVLVFKVGHCFLSKGPAACNPHTIPFETLICLIAPICATGSYNLKTDVNEQNRTTKRNIEIKLTDWQSLGSQVRIINFEPFGFEPYYKKRIAFNIKFTNVQILAFKFKPILNKFWRRVGRTLKIRNRMRLSEKRRNCRRRREGG